MSIPDEVLKHMNEIQTLEKLLGIKPERPPYTIKDDVIIDDGLKLCMIDNAWVVQRKDNKYVFFDGFGNLREVNLYRISRRKEIFRYITKRRSCIDKCTQEDAAYIIEELDKIEGKLSLIISVLQDQFGDQHGHS